MILASTRPRKLAWSTLRLLLSHLLSFYCVGIGYRGAIHTGQSREDIETDGFDLMLFGTKDAFK